MNTSPKLDIKCFITSHKPEGEKGSSLTKAATETGMHGVIRRSMESQGHVALAASGGRMGGRRSSSFRSSSGRSRSRSHSSRSSRPSYSSSGSYSTLVGSPAPINTAEAEQNGFHVFMGYSILVCLAVFAIKGLVDAHDAAKTSVLKLQVGSLGTGRSLQRQLNRIAELADTSTSGGLDYVLQETILALLRHSDYCISGHSSVDVKESVSEGEKIFDQLSVEERGKFDEETLVNVNNIKKKSATSHSSNGLPNEYIVVTILVVAHGVLELPPIKSGEELKKALQKLASIPSSNIMGAEVLWTPQKEDDSLTREELLADYPLLHSI
ncbi:hypothetical protein HanXRQr2_Chr15g0703191 [Helianthus annuus]|uniref:DUF1517 domain-containing protein n=1 Tax=Helianthus annuus TaxID=4232 RepID=A0A9K3E1P7_HELAN|nr:hypothetical protein HanXRQr2_Chr15g0703191 [Helianthus annuus]KAJ0451921.1 hypothetical protein HanHA300_Chr15g0573121 [Helianthus annuus]KAJ0456644.1 hypothetical protein HanIR_Chr15g0764841 [Helianthus annuus]KAJ0473806.1 hypothetical protein HanHA89_Chr15g0622601 [Helianthus annuus]KAJ0649381.1 hypothetical protein HanLR1_Chr15g0583681 [Helianthus annuus]